MISSIRSIAGAATIAVAAITMAAPVAAQDYPHDTVTLVTHSRAGGGTDVFLREMTKYLGTYLGANFVVENVRGGSGAKAMAKLAEERARRESGLYVPKADFDRALAQRALLFKQDLKNFAHAAAPEICATVDCDHTLVPDLILLLLRKFEDFLDRYAQPGRVWEVDSE